MKSSMVMEKLAKLTVFFIIEKEHKTLYHYNSFTWARTQCL